MRSGGVALHPLDILFWACLMLGGIYTLFTLVLGGLSDIAGHGHAIGHVGDASHVPDLGGHHTGDFAAGDAGLDVAQGDAGLATDHGADHGVGDHHTEGQFHLLAYLNPMSVAGFLLGFGGIGVVSGLLQVPLLARLLYAVAGGGGLWLMAYLLITRMFGRAGGTSHTRREDLVGVRGQVTAPIARSQPGMVSYTVAGTRQSVRAITDEAEPIPTGALVRIRKIENNTAHVVRID